MTTPSDTPATPAESDSTGTGEGRNPEVIPLSQRSMSPTGVPLPPDMRSGPVVVGVDDVAACGRPLRGAAFMARAFGRPLVAVHVRRRAVPLVEGYVPIPEDVQLDDSAEDAIEAALSVDLAASGELDGIDWELVSTSGDAAAELIRIAEARDAALLVVGKRHSGFAQFLHRIASGSVSHAVVSSQKFPVLVVP